MTDLLLPALLRFSFDRIREKKSRYRCMVHNTLVALHLVKRLSLFQSLFCDAITRVFVCVPTQVVACFFAPSIPCVFVYVCIMCCWG